MSKKIPFNLCLSPEDKLIQSLRAENEALKQQVEQGKRDAVPEGWNQVQICTWIGNQLMRQPTMFERNAVCRYVRSLGRDETLAKHVAAAPKQEK